MKFYIVKLGLSGPMSQPEMIDLLGNAGCQFIQTSDGVCVKTTKEISELKSSHEKLNLVNFETLDLKASAQMKTLTPDIQAFINS